MRLLLLASLATASQVALSVQRLPSGDALAVQVHNGGPGPVTVPSCETLQVEVFDPAAERWTPVPSRACQRTEPAMSLEPGEHTFQVPIAVQASALVRVVLVFGLGCREGLPLDEAGCSGHEAAVSGSLTAFPPEER